MIFYCLCCIKWNECQFCKYKKKEDKMVQKKLQVNFIKDI